MEDGRLGAQAGLRQARGGLNDGAEGMKKYSGNSVFLDASY
jgi:hypothetical protein